MDRARDPLAAAAGQAEEARTRRALLHMLEDLRREQASVSEARRSWVDTVDALGDPLMVHDAQLRVVRCNGAYAERAGMKLADILGRPYWQCFPKGPGPLPACLLPIEAGASSTHDTEVRLDTGEVFVSRAYAVGKDHPPQVLHVFENVTEKRRARAALEASEARYRAMFNQAAVAMIQTSLGGALLTVNPAFCKILGYSKAELEGRAFATFTHPDDRAMSAAQKSALTGGNVASQAVFEKRYLRKDGSVVWASVCVAPVCNEAGKPEYFVTLVEDITERKLAERTLRESEEKFRAIFDRTRDGMMVMNIEERNVRFANASMEHLLGYGTGELAGAPLARLHPAEALAQVGEQFADGARGGMHLVQDLPMQKKNGDRLYVDLNGGLIEIEGRECLLGAFRDATERRANEEKLRSQVEELQRWQGLNLDREDRVIELKREVNQLARQLNLPPRYADGE